MMNDGRKLRTNQVMSLLSLGGFLFHYLEVKLTPAYRKMIKRLDDKVELYKLHVKHYFTRTPRWKSGVYVHFVHRARVFVHVEAGVVLMLTSDCFGTYFTHAQT